MLTRNTKVALAVSLFFLLCGTGFAQGWRWQDRDHDGYWDRDHDRRAYDNGFRDGRHDRQHNRRPHPRHENNRSYVAGYRAGYGEHPGWRNDRDVYRGPYGNGPYGGRGSVQNVQRIAYDNGFREGERYGLADRNNGHSNRPTYSDKYKHGDFGYNSSMGDKSAYKHAFQEGFRAGYARGYNSGYRR